MGYQYSVGQEPFGVQPKAASTPPTKVTLPQNEATTLVTLLLPGPTQSVRAVTPAQDLYQFTA
jgi:hypothetical protein